MSIELISLRKLMQLMLSDERRRTALLRANITEEIRRERTGPGEGGGDFHSPFWSDAKKHVEGLVDLRAETPLRIDANWRRRRLYPPLTQGFLDWWEERRRRRNEPFTMAEAQVRGRLDLAGLGVVKVENNLAFTIGDDEQRVVYPYFCEDPAMAEDVARIGLWAMDRAIDGAQIADMRILDVIRGRSFSIMECPQRGTEEAEFRQQYEALLNRWRALRREY